MKTKKEMIAILEAAGVVVSKKANVVALTALLAEHNLDGDSTEDEAEGGEGDGEGEVAEQSSNDAPPATGAAVTATTRETTVGTVVAPKSLKIEKDRPVSNGISRPSLGGICRAIWDRLDAISTAGQPLPTAKQLALSNGWNLSTVGRQSAEWRKFNGMPKKGAEDATAE